MSSSLRRYMRPLAALLIATTATMAGAGAAQARPAPPTQAAAAVPAEDTRAFMRLEVADSRPFVGEAIAAKLKVYIRDDTGATLDGMPRIDAPELVVLEAAKDFVQSREVVGQVAYKVAAFEVLVSPAIAGPIELQATLPLTLSWREIVRRKVETIPQDLAHMFVDDPFMREFFGTFEQTSAIERRRRAELEAEPVTVTARALPTQGKPPGFGGAVGRFTLAAAISPATVTVGQPADLTVTVDGAGNFDRVAFAGVEARPDLKVYAPDATTVGEGLSRTKTFRQVVVPTSAEVRGIPPVELHFFDPDEERYVTAHSDAMPVAVVPADDDAADAQPAGAPSADDDYAYSTLQPPFLGRSFWAWQLAPLGLVLGVAGAAAATRRRERTAACRERDARVATALEDLRAAAEMRSTKDFLAAAYAALQHRFGVDAVDARSLTPAEIVARLGEAAPRLGPLLEAMDAARYGRELPDGFDFESTQRLIVEEVKS